ncbi:DUF3592 domain-containing protein [Carnobacterium maltaromaticum]|uniref:DUF3592 domain-containing protein n=1 Tax=Carnobacterium maltaromaticum TaxID=2751 RepID=UPI00295F23E1|nr:DUF3592 domain-containing protein [Carnobacterium maltaromaticum]
MYTGDFMYLCSAYGVGHIIYTLCKRSKYKKNVIGQIIKIQPITKEIFDTKVTYISYEPIVEYIVDKNKYTKMIPQKNPKDPYKVGDQVRIFFNERNPKKSYKEGELNIEYLIGGMFIILGLIFVFLLKQIM